MQVLIVACFIASVAPATSLITVEPAFRELTTSPRSCGVNGIGVDHVSFRGLVTCADVDIATVYHKATCKGEKLLAAITSPHGSAAAYIAPIDSPWTNVIQQGLAIWDYKIDTDYGTTLWRTHHYDECEFAHNHKFKNMFDELGIDTLSTWQTGRTGATSSVIRTVQQCSALKTGTYRLSTSNGVTSTESNTV
ncbi:uncharacterized protein ALTATR162_LOCUS3001 [Alternaria atra]|uniref:Ecp2 effector protein domain-containing protein n=1 Tax=Alternaria atra TaxID=119953 RepID=A0A8J2MZN7_9PLEO|nr:uncharacterized protein ALTATR162_LOCUS3001 [Alternaria atra]CAG5153013.1 unnamed protein product [Alternaria atra]